MKKISILLLALALMVGMAVPAMAEVDFSHYFEVGNNYYDNDEDGSWAYYYLFINGQAAENVTFYSEIDFGYSFDQESYDNDIAVFESWANIEEIAGPVDLKIGRMQQYSAGVGGNAKIGAHSALYAFDTEEFGVLKYQEDNIAAKIGHSVDNDKRMFAEASMTDLGILDEVTLNYVDDNNSETTTSTNYVLDENDTIIEETTEVTTTNDYNGYTLKFAKEINPG